MQCLQYTWSTRLNDILSSYLRLLTCASHSLIKTILAYRSETLVWWGLVAGSALSSMEPGFYLQILAASVILYLCFFWLWEANFLPSKGYVILPLFWTGCTKLSVIAVLNFLPTNWMCFWWVIVWKSKFTAMWVVLLLVLENSLPGEVMFSPAQSHKQLLTFERKSIMFDEIIRFPFLEKRNKVQAADG